MTATVSGFGIDTNASDIQPTGSTAEAGSTGLAADAGHAHVGGSGSWPGTAVGDTAYGGSAGAITRLPGNTSATRKFYRSQGTGSAATAPAWDTLQPGDIPSGVISGAISPMASPFFATPGTGADCAAAINSAANAAAAFGGALYLTAAEGIWTTKSPVIIPPCVSVVTDGAQENTTYEDSSLGTIIQPAASWSQGSCPANAVVALLGQSDGGWSVVANEQKITGLYVDCHLLPGTLSSTDGVQLYGGTGRTHLERVLIGHAPNCGFNCVTDGGGHSPGSFRLDRVNVRYAGNATSPAQGYGFWIDKPSDVTLRDCLAENCSSDGFNVVNLSNGELLACRSEHNGTNGVGNGYTYTCTNSSTGSGTAIFNGCSSDRNEGNGILITSTNNSGVPVQLAGCRFRRDGRNNNPSTSLGTGGGNLAGIAVTNYPGTVIIDISTAVFPGVDDGGGSVNSPEFGIRLYSNFNGPTYYTYVVADGGHIQGATQAISDDGSAQHVYYGASGPFASGTTGSPSVIPSRTTVVVAPPSGDNTGATDSALIAAAIAACPSGGTVQLMPGAGYVVASPINCGGITIQGFGASSPVVQGTSWSGSALFKPTSSFRLTGVTAVSGASSHLLDFGNNYMTQVEIDHCAFEATGGHVFTNPNMHQSWIHDCVFTVTSGAYGIWNMGTSGSGVSTSSFDRLILTAQNGSGGSRSVAAWQIWVATNKTVDTLRFNEITCFSTASGSGEWDNTQYFFDIACMANAANHDFDRISFTQVDGGNVLGGLIRILSAASVVLDKATVGNVYAQGSPSNAVGNSFIYVGTWNGAPPSSLIAAYNSGTAYTTGQFVTYSGNSYQCILATTGNAPSGTTSNNTWWDYATPGPGGSPSNGQNSAGVIISGYCREDSAAVSGSSPPHDIEISGDTTDVKIIAPCVPDSGSPQPVIGLNGAANVQIDTVSSGAAVYGQNTTTGQKTITIGNGVIMVGTTALTVP